jgi:hypothetical protein
MADRKISDLTALTTPASGDYLPIVDISEASAANKNKRITIEELLRGAPNGTAAAPGIAFESDPDSGLYSAGANTVAISTGGTERGRIDSSGRYLVGTSTAFSTIRLGTLVDTSPTLQIVGSAFSTANAAVLRSTVGPAYFTVGCGSSGNNVSDGTLLGRLNFVGYDGSAHTTAAFISAEVDGVPGVNDMPGRLVFSVTLNNASSPTEAMRIKNSRIINFTNTPAYADNTAALAGGLVAGDVYRKSDGTLMITY